MKYALLIYSEIPQSGEQRELGPMDPALAAVLARPAVTGWIRLRNQDSATTVRAQGTKTVLSDGPFVDSKEFLAGLVIVEADNLDGALAVAAELQESRPAVTIEVRPIFEQELGGA
jgi:hypothetical protein